MNAKEKPQASPATKPIRPGLFVERPRPLLLGSQCKETGKVFFPAQRMNPETHTEGTMEPVRIEGSGTLYSFTKVVRGLSGFASPYMLGVIQLDAGPSLIAQLEGWQGLALKEGMRVELVVGQIKQEPDGTALIGPKFRPVPA
jgi:uncharacterized OB-fold protein